MSGAAWRAALPRLIVLLLALLLVTAAVAVAFAAGGRSTGQAVAAGSGVVGILVALLGVVLLGIARRGDGRVTQLTGLGALALAVPFLVVALIA